MDEFSDRLKRSSEFRACTQCGCPAEQLRWMSFATPKYMWMKLAGTEGYLGLCEKCKRQVGYFETRCN